MRWKTLTVSLIVSAASATLYPPHPATALDRATMPSNRTLNPAEISAHAQWVIYLNIDNTMAMPDAGALLARYLNTHPKVKKTIRQADVIIGNRFPDDFHDVVITGNNAGPGQGQGVVLIHAIASQDHIDKMLSLNPANTTITVDNRIIHIIPGKHDQTTFEVSPMPGTFVVSRSEKSLVDELKVLRGQAPAMTTHGSLLAGAGRGTIFYLADTALAESAKPHGPHQGSVWLAHVRSAWLAAHRKDGTLQLVGRIEAKTATAAAEMARAARGIQSMLELTGTSATANPHQRFLAAVVRGLKVRAAGTTVRLHLAMTLRTLLTGLRRNARAGQ